MSDRQIKKAIVRKKANKAIVTQDNRFVYAKYDMNTNEMKFFMWIIAQIHSQRDQLFQICEIPLDEIFEIWQWKDERLKTADYSYVKHICDSMAKKTYVEDFKLKDEKTMKNVEVFRAMPLFKFIEYKNGQGFISYQLNDVLMQYLLNLKKNFTQLKFSDIQRMKSAYSIRIYNMLIAELNQNRQNLKINLAVLQNILEVPESLKKYDNFNRRVLQQAIKDINTKSNIILFEIKTYKTGRAITELDFIFDYKNNDKQKQREKAKETRLKNRIAAELEKLTGKELFLKNDEKSFKAKYIGYDLNKNDEIIANFVYYNSNNTEQKAFIIVNNLDFIKTMKESIQKCEENFYDNKQKIKNLQLLKGVGINKSNATEQEKNKAFVNSLLKNSFKKI